MRKVITTYTGKVEKDIYGRWDDVDKGFFINEESIDSILWDFKNKNVKITIEEIEEDND